MVNAKTGMQKQAAFWQKFPVSGRISALKTTVNYCGFTIILLQAIVFMLIFQCVATRFDFNALVRRIRYN
jgi:hypothetical protein